MPVLFYIISLNYTIKVIDLVSLKMKYLHWEGLVYILVQRPYAMQ